MSADSGPVATAGPGHWVASHPGLAALAAAAAAYAGAIAVAVGVIHRAGGMPAGHGGPLAAGPIILLGALLFVAGLPAALGLAGTCCATQRELWPGVVAGLAAVILTLVVVAILGPPHMTG